MNDIISIDPANLIEETKSPFYLVVLTTDSGRLLNWQRTGYTQIAEHNTNVTLFKRSDAQEAYYNALRNARGETYPPLFSHGNLQLIPVNIG